MTIPRALILAKGENVYHCISRCVLRAYLCGQDFQTGKPIQILACPMLFFISSNSTILDSYQKASVQSKY